MKAENLPGYHLVLDRNNISEGSIITVWYCRQNEGTLYLGISNAFGFYGVGVTSDNFGNTRVT